MPLTIPCHAPATAPAYALAPATAPVYAHNQLLPPAPVSVSAGMMGIWERYKDKGPTPSCDGASPLCGLIQHVRLTKMQRLLPQRGCAAAEPAVPCPKQSRRSQLTYVEERRRGRTGSVLITELQRPLRIQQPSGLPFWRDGLQIWRPERGPTF